MFRLLSDQKRKALELLRMPTATVGEVAKLLELPYEKVYGWKHYWDTLPQETRDLLFSGMYKFEVETEEIVQSTGECKRCGHYALLGNGVCTRCWDKGHGK